MCTGILLRKGKWHWEKCQWSASDYIGWQWRLCRVSGGEESCCLLALGCSSPAGVLFLSTPVWMRTHASLRNSHSENRLNRRITSFFTGQRGTDTLFLEINWTQLPEESVTRPSDRWVMKGLALTFFSLWCLHKSSPPVTLALSLHLTLYSLMPSLLPGLTSL